MGILSLGTKFSSRNKYYYLCIIVIHVTLRLLTGEVGRQVEGTHSDGVGRQSSRAKSQTASARSPGPRPMWPRRRLQLPSNAPGLGRERHLGAASNVP